MCFCTSIRNTLIITIILSKCIMIQKNIICNRKLLFASSILLTITIIFTMGNLLLENKIIAQQQQQQKQQTLSSIPHNAKGHESHQIVNFIDLNDSVIYKGTVAFNSSKPVDIISYTEATGNQTTNSTIKFWEIGDKKFIPKTLLKNSTNGNVSFEGNGIIAHSTQSNPYKVTFTTNSNSTKNMEGTIVLGPLLKIFR